MVQNEECLRETYCNIDFRVLGACIVAEKLHQKHVCYKFVDLVGSEYPNAQMRVYCTCLCHIRAISSAVRAIVS